MDETRICQSELFSWRNGWIVLFVDSSDESWFVIRGWLEDDRFVNVRRWQFDSDRRVVVQVRRLIEEATGDASCAADAAGRLTDWLVSNTHPA
jgi:hypothetical protein